MTQIKHIIFDLSEVLIAGMVGSEEGIARIVGAPVEEVVPALYNPTFFDLMCGRISEREYFMDLLKQNGWSGDLDELGRVVRENFHIKFPAAIRVAERLGKSFELTLHSDHATEWVPYILKVHPFITDIFPRRLFSCELQSMKKDPHTFERVLKMIGARPEECLLIDDNPANIKAAHEIGMQGIVYKDAAQLTKELVAVGIALPKVRGQHREHVLNP